MEHPGSLRKMAPQIVEVEAGSGRCKKCQATECSLGSVLGYLFSLAKVGLTVGCWFGSDVKVARERNAVRRRANELGG